MIADADNDNLYIEVRDTGIGIPEEMISDIFKLFHQLDGSTTRKYEGIGLGMYICKSIVEMHGGRIWVESGEGKGTTVHVSLPISEINH